MNEAAESLLAGLLLQSAAVPTPEVQAIFGLGAPPGVPGCRDVALVRRGQASPAALLMLLETHAAAFASLDPASPERARAWSAVVRATADGASTEDALRSWFPNSAAADPAPMAGSGDPAELASTRVPISAGPSSKPTPEPEDLTVRSVPPGSAHERATLVAASGQMRDSGSSLGSRAPAAADGRSGARLGRYHLQEEIGRGGMGIVYRAWDPELRREVAIKTMLAEAASDPKVVERFQREARTSAALCHPRIVPVYEVGCAGATPYFVMEYVRGTTLSRAIQEPAFATLRARIRLVAEVAGAIAHAHGQRVVHRDLKPSNILVDAQGAAHVMDFGLAKQLDELNRVTVSGEILGTPQYMPPEQMGGRAESVGPAADVYSLGAILYEVLTGAPPFRGDTFAEVVARTLTEEPVPPQRRDPRVPLDVQTICLKALGKETHHRYPSGLELAADLERWLNGEAIHARPERWWERAARWSRRRPAAAALVTASVLATAIACTEAIQSAQARRERIELSRQVVSSLRENVGAYLDAALLVRRSGGRIREASEVLLGPLQRAVDRAVERAPELAEPHARLGRVYRALLLDDAALQEQERALAKEPTYAPSLYERAVLLSRAVARRARELRDARMRESDALRRLGEDPPGSAPASVPSDEAWIRSDPEVDRLCVRAKADLAVLDREHGLTGGSANEGSGVGPAGADGLSQAHLDCAWGMLLVYGSVREEDCEAGRARLERALAANPTLEEACETLVYLAARQGRIDDALAACSRGLAQDQGYTPLLLERANLLRALAERATEVDQADALLVRAVTDLARVIDLDPTSLIARVDHAAALEFRAYLAASGGRDPRPLLEEALQDCNAALTQQPDAALALETRGSVHGSWGLLLDEHGDDGESHFAAAVEDLNRVGSGADVHPRVWRSRARIRVNWASARATRQRDPESLFVDAETDFQRALAADPGAVDAWSHRGNLHLNWALFEADRGTVRDDLFAKAEQYYTEAVQRTGESVRALADRGDLRTQRALHTEPPDAEVEARLAAAAADFDLALTKSGPDPALTIKRVYVDVQRGGWLASQGRDPARAFDRAAAMLEEALQGESPDPVLCWEAGGLLASMERWEVACATFERAEKLDPARRAVYAESSARAHFGLAQEQAARSVEPGIDPDSSRRLRDGAFRHLGIAAASATWDPEEVAADADLAALHADPRWEAFLRELTGK